MTLVPNLHPTLPDPAGRRLAIVGEAPGADEELAKEPFVGASGRLLRLVLDHSGINPRACFIGNICQVRPPGNDIEEFDWDGTEIQSGIEALRQDLAIFRPHTILALGRTAFRFFNPDKCYAVKSSKANPRGFAIPLQDWRGSIFTGSTGHKTVAAFHPAYILRAFGDIAYFRSDVQRAVRHSVRPDWVPTVRNGNTRPTLQEVVEFLTALRLNRTPASFDIEGWSDAIGVTMLSICPTPSSGIVIPFWIDGKAYWSEDDEPIVWRLLAEWLADPDCPKKGHNIFYETLVLGWRHRCVVDGIVADTMMKHWSFYNELEKSLAVAASMWTEEPYYKDERESSNSSVKLLYNFKDSAVTEEVDRAIEPVLAKYPAAYEHYRFNVSLIPAITYTHLRGCRFDAGRAAAHRKRAAAELAVLMESIDEVTKPILGHEFNVKSTPDKQWLLYDYLGLPIHKRYGPSTKEEVLHRAFVKTRNETLRRVIQAVALRTRLSDIEKLAPNPDGRIRTSYDLVGTVTGRLSSRDSSTTELHVTARGKVVHEEFGTNLQNVTKALRDVFVPDSDDFLFFQCDLSGADAWTVAADLAALNAPHMLEDLRAGVKPSKLLLRMLEVLDAKGDPTTIARLNSQDAKRETDKVVIPEGILPDGRPGDWFYTSLKRVQHGTNYDGQADTISATIFKDSDGVIDIPSNKIEEYQRLYRLRYNTSLRSQWMRNHLIETGGVLQTAAGIRRRFFGIRNPRSPDDEIIRAALASEPQANTTYLTNLALKRLWYDPANRRKSGALFIEPLLQIHDALAGQFPVRLRAFAKEKLYEYFDNEITVHGIKIKIPVEIKVGRSWGEVKESI